MAVLLVVPRAVAEAQPHAAEPDGGDLQAASAECLYHDQGQIAMKLIGFDRGVTLLGGFPFPICTPAHGSAYDIAGQGVANLGASKAAVLLAATMAARRRS